MQNDILSRIRVIAERVQEYVDPTHHTITKLEERLLFNENLFLPDEIYLRILDELRHRVNETIRFYPSQSLKQKVLRKLCDIYGLDEKRVMLTAGADEGIKLTLELARMLELDEIIIVRPCYSMPMIYCNNMLLNWSYVLIEDEHRLPVEKILEKAHGKKILVYICNPNNPLGIEFPLDDVAEIAANVSGLVVVDETYFEYGHQDHTRLLRHFENIIIIRSLSKSWGIAGLRVGYIVSNSHVVKILRGLAQPFNLTSFTLHFLDLLLEYHDIVRRLIDEARQVRSYLQEELKKLKFVEKVFPSSTNFVTFKVRKDLPVDFLIAELAKRRIFIRKVTEPLCENCARITVAPRSVIEAVLHKLREVESEVT